MELPFKEGVDLRNVLMKKTFSKFGKDKEAVIIHYFSSLVCALDSIHRKGFIYRDFKPDNVLIDHEGRVFLTDFEFGFHEYLAQDDMLLILLAYLAPTFQCNFDQIKAKISDIPEASDLVLRSASLEFDLKVFDADIHPQLDALLATPAAPHAPKPPSQVGDPSSNSKLKLKAQTPSKKSARPGKVPNFEKNVIRFQGDWLARARARESKTPLAFFKKARKGSKEYYAPEILANSSFSFASDYWALGCTIFDLYEGVTLFWKDEEDSLDQSISQKILNFEVRLMSSCSISSQAFQVFEQLLSRNPGKRVPQLDLMSLFGSRWLGGVDPSKILNKKNPLIPQVKKIDHSRETLYYKKVFYEPNPTFFVQKNEEFGSKPFALKKKIKGVNLKNIFKEMESEEASDDSKGPLKPPTLRSNNSKPKEPSLSTNLMALRSQESSLKVKNLNSSENLWSPGKFASEEFEDKQKFILKRRSLFKERYKKFTDPAKVKTNLRNKTINLKHLKFFKTSESSSHQQTENKDENSWSNTKNVKEPKIYSKPKNNKNIFLELLQEKNPGFANDSPAGSHSGTGRDLNPRPRKDNKKREKRKVKFKLINQSNRLKAKDAQKNKFTRQMLPRPAKKSSQHLKRKSQRTQKTKSKKIANSRRTTINKNKLNDRSIREIHTQLKRRWDNLFLPGQAKFSKSRRGPGRREGASRPQKVVDLSNEVFGDVGNRKHNKRLQGSIDWFQRKIDRKNKEVFQSLFKK